ncbi:hypothetical protein JRQ81_015384 [Phrynocephalus forsythii]|uniref:SGNH hydrolase-type esterase domain-containing protein n=1 Tax=Phrynocephalus forsythii TaxID=171643 RepID=A0A9Q1B1Q3_9SAUR|nr:hypothetical protein JRQ81_015384 [Phrynocephalus forsythii]
MLVRPPVSTSHYALGSPAMAEAAAQTEADAQSPSVVMPPRASGSTASVSTATMTDKLDDLSSSKPGINDLPQGNESLPLGYHLSEAMIDKITSGKFVDIFELLNREVDSKELEKLDDKEKERIRKRKPDRSWNNWLNAFVMLSALYYYARAQGFAIPDCQFRISKMVEGWSRERGRPRDTRTPISPNMLCRLADVWPRVCSTSYEVALFQAATLVAFFAALRVSELLAQSKTDNSLYALLWSDMALEQDQVFLHIRRSKTDQRGSTPGSCVRVLVYGHSFVYWASKFAIRSGHGRDLGLGQWAEFLWKGKRGMSWHAFLTVTLSDRPDTLPNIVVVHLGGNDLTRMSGKSLILKIIDDLRAFHRTHPLVRVVWSAIIPRLHWGPYHHPQKMHKTRKGVNREVARVVQAEMGSVIWHSNITARDPTLFRLDGVHLSDKGLDIFLQNLKEGLSAELFSCGVKSRQCASLLAGSA